MPNARFKKLPPERQAHILDAAAKAFAEQGLEGASINNILAQAGLSKGAAYYYFEDKADLFDTVARHCWESFVEHIDFSLDGLTARNFWDRVASIQRHATEHMATDPVITTMAKVVWRQERDTGDALAEIQAWCHGWIGELVQKGQRLGVVRTDLPTELLIALAAAIDHATDTWLALNVGIETPERAIEVSMQMLAAMRCVLEPKKSKR